MASWAQEEIGTANLGDRRLNLRLGKLLEQVGGHPQWSLPAACGGWAELQAAYRFFDNEKVTFQQVLAPHRDATLERMAACPVVLLVQDTTENDERLSLGPKGLGTLPMEEKHARRLHPTVAFTPDRICLGVVQAAWWERGEPSPRRERRYKGVDEKESYRWLASYQESCALQGQLPTTRLVNLADAEGDLYEWFQEHAECAPEVRADWIVRAAQDRRLLDAHGGTAKLWETLAQAPALGTVDVEVRRRPNRPARMAVVTLRSATVRLAPPARPGFRLAPVQVNAVLAREDAPPPDVAPLEWLLLTSLPVAGFEAAATVVAWYACRWSIEVYFHVLKTGCCIEDLQLRTPDRYLPCLGLYMIVAWRVLFTLMLGRNGPELDCEVLFDVREWQAAYIVVKRCPPPDTPPTLGEVVLLIARLGGYLGRRHDPPPGPKAIWIGLQRLRDLVWALEAHEQVLLQGRENSCV
jgi:hypothetical protein